MRGERFSAYGRDLNITCSVCLFFYAEYLEFKKRGIWSQIYFFQKYSATPSRLFVSSHHSDFPIPHVSDLCHLLLSAQENNHPRVVFSTGGERGIRTLGNFRYACFQDKSIRPLWHLSNWSTCTFKALQT